MILAFTLYISVSKFNISNTIFTFDFSKYASLWLYLLRYTFTLMSSVITPISFFNMFVSILYRFSICTLSFFVSLKSFSIIRQLVIPDVLIILFRESALPLTGLYTSFPFIFDMLSPFIISVLLRLRESLFSYGKYI